MKHWRLSVTQRLFILTAVALLPMIAILLYNVIDLRRSREAEVHLLALRFGQLASLEMERIFSGAVAVLRVVAAAPDLQRSDALACGRYLASVREKLPQFMGIVAIDAAGQVRCRSEPFQDETDLADRQHVIDVMRTGEASVGEFATSPGSGVQYVPVVVPMMDESGALRGVVAAGLDLAWLGERLREREFLKGSALTIADRKGVIIAREPLADRFVGTRIPDDFRKLVTADAPGTREVVSQDGTSRILGYYPATLSPVGLYVSTGISKDEAFSSIDRATNRGLILTLLAGSGALLTAWATGWGFFRRPLQRIVGAIGAWRDGDETARTGMRADGGEIETVGVAVDVFLDELLVARRERRRHEEQRELMVRELDHRVKNIVAMVQSVARQTFRGDGTSADRLETFSNRLAVMSRAHEMLMLDRWSSADIEQAVDAPLSLYGGRGNPQFTVNGPSLTIKPKVALALSMAVHELCTNASKYGALATAAGCIGISWGIDMAGAEPRFWFTWSENNGPPVVAPAKGGFGSRMITRVLAAELSASVDLSFPTTGATCRIEAAAADVLLGKQEVESDDDRAFANAANG